MNLLLKCHIFMRLRSYSHRPVVPGGAGGAMPWHPQIMADQLTLSQPGGEDYAHHINTGTPEFSDLPTALSQPFRSGNMNDQNSFSGAILK